MYVHELADTSYVIRDGDRVIRLSFWRDRREQEGRLRVVDRRFVIRTDGRASANACYELFQEHAAGARGVYQIDGL